MWTIRHLQILQRRQTCQTVADPRCAVTTLSLARLAQSCTSWTCVRGAPVASNPCRLRGRPAYASSPGAGWCADFVSGWVQVAYLHNLGMSKSDLVKLRDTREQLFYLSLPTIRSKLMFLQDVVSALVTGADTQALVPGRSYVCSASAGLVGLRF